MEAHIQINGNLSLENYSSDNIDDDYDHEQISDCESCISNENERIQGLFGDDYLIRLNENDAIFDVIGHVFMSNMGGFGKKNNTIIEAIHKMNWSYSRTMLARFKCFNIFRAALLEDDDNSSFNNGVTSCMKYGWYCDDKDGIQRIVSLGFGHLQLGNRDGVRLSPVNSLAQSVQNCGIDENGLKHVILCRVLVENGESSKELNSEVDDVVSPSEYIVWSTKMNTHILPEYVVSFRTFLCLDGFSKGGYLGKKPAASPWLPFSTLISTISEFLPPPTINLINEHYKDFKKGKITRRNMIERLTRYVGKELLIKIIKRCGAKIVSP
ncbi:probable inactive poly [ADP-ribose] polymerase SRO2 isoform X1 [Beta vulgaris subsp. vulgaris]|uniref:probable inactive poly [ADP-ribose] polymerase SRO2 isoform X1 n=1 Tax=Beta vulgaris subsp. vulgaris TaxID=3555 RepID=UPI0020375D1F|nr:probable inactive poly [ADP-ribose] polymerase SRO2 isoform X1 [Beta vulgaris subsp. vulgaris]XP_057251237.1 probable inactive poly [ADP-ribose] polymerase SRO2 isoform X1 [Beta vulgaris subsp. vulgaris]